MSPALFSRFLLSFLGDLATWRFAELKTLLRQLRESGRICVRGEKRGARWHFGPEDGTIA
jgi:hypothetical protein